MPEITHREFVTYIDEMYAVLKQKVTERASEEGCELDQVGPVIAIMFDYLKTLSAGQDGLRLTPRTLAPKVKVPQPRQTNPGDFELLANEIMFPGGKDGDKDRGRGRGGRHSGRKGSSGLRPRDQRL